METPSWRIDKDPGVRPARAADAGVPRATASYAKSLSDSVCVERATLSVALSAGSRDLLDNPLSRRDYSCSASDVRGLGEINSG